MITVLLGVFLTVTSLRESIQPISIMSDLFAFEARVAGMPNGDAILHLGGEKDGVSLHSLIMQLDSLRDSSWIYFLIGGSIILVGLIGFLADAFCGQRRAVEPADRGEPPQ